MKLYNLCYLIKNDDILMLYRNKKENDINKDKWIGIGGKIENNETPHESIKREVLEETGYNLIDSTLRGIVSFEYNNEMDYIFVFSSKNFEGELVKECSEGELKYINKKDVLKLNLWEGDKYFLKHILEDDYNFFSYKMEYENDKLIKVTKEM